MQDNSPHASDRSGAIPAIAAATVIVMRSGPDGGLPQLLLAERSEGLAFAGGATVFPGGRVEPGDGTLAQELLAQARAGAVLNDIAARIAAVRETLEETGLALALRSPDRPITQAEAEAAREALASGDHFATVLARRGWTLDLTRLIPWARWRPTGPHVRVFDARFYLADLGTGAVGVSADRSENRHLFWASAAEALAMADRGDIRVIFPTRRNLERLAQFDSAAACTAHAHATPVTLIEPYVVRDDGVDWLTIPDGLGYPVLRQRLDEVERG